MIFIVYYVITMPKRVYINQDKLHIIQEAINKPYIDINSVNDIEYWVRDIEYQVEVYDINDNEIYNDGFLVQKDVINDLGEEVASLIINRRGELDEDGWYSLSNVNIGNIASIMYRADESYDIELTDIQGGVIYQEDKLYADELQEKLGNKLASMITNHEGTFSQGSYVISDLMSEIKVDVNNVEEVNALAKKMFTSYNDNYSGKVHGWLLTDGTILDFGGHVDHLSICWVNGMTLGKFEDLGNIRIGYNSFELCQYPTQEQKAQLRKLIAVNDEVYVDICKYKGSGNYPDTLTSARYYNPSYTRIMGQIDQFFRDGIQLRGFSEIDENIQLEVEPNEVDLTSFKERNSLHPQFWMNDLLDSRIRLKLLDIADDFLETLKLKWIKPIDIVLTGSICNFNWSEFSDVDIHIIIDFNEVDENTDLVREYVNTKKNEWNNEHDSLMIHDLPIELYVEDLSDETTSEGIYSLNTNEWLKQPKNAQEMHISERGSKIKNVAADLMTMIDDLEEEFNSNQDSHQLEVLSKRVDKMLKNISKIRKMGLGSELKEKSLGNILYKILRRTEYLDKIWSLKVKIYDKLNSII